MFSHFSQNQLVSPSLVDFVIVVMLFVPDVHIYLKQYSLEFMEMIFPCLIGLLLRSFILLALPVCSSSGIIGETGVSKEKSPLRQAN